MYHLLRRGMKNNITGGVVRAYLVAPGVDGLVQNHNIRHVCMLQRVQLLHIAAVAVLLQLGEGVSNAQIELVALGFGLNDRMVPKLQTHTAQKAVGFHHQKTDAFVPAQSCEGSQLVFR